MIEQLTAWGSLLSGVFTLGLFAVALWSARRAIREYGSRTGLEKAQWLARLFEKFYEHKSYKKIRQAIDFEELIPILTLIDKDLSARSGTGATFSRDEKDLLDEFTDYLNFFELVAYLRELNQLEERDVRAMFSYYLDRMREVDGDGKILRYIRESGYEHLVALLSAPVG